MRRVELRTEHGSEAAATAIARAVRPDNTDRIHTAVEDGAVVGVLSRSDYTRALTFQREFRSGLAG